MIRDSHSNKVTYERNLNGGREPCADIWEKNVRAKSIQQVQKSWKGIVHGVFKEQKEARGTAAG